MRGARLRVRAAARHVPPAHHHLALTGRVPPHPGLFATVPRRLPREVLLMHRPLTTDLPAAIVLYICLSVIDICYSGMPLNKFY